jgi:aldehyde dehydrogenase (NAD+)
MSSYQSFIDGKWVSASDGKTFANLNPADTRDEVGQFADLTVEDMNKACEAAGHALPAWRALGGPGRAAFLDKAARILESRVDEVAAALTREEGKTLMESGGETLRGVAILRFYAGEGSRAFGEVLGSANPKTLLYTNRTPIGVVSLITPWNFPIAIPLWKMAPALVFGNTVLYKPSPFTPLTAVLLGKVLEEAGFPAGVVSVLTTTRREAAEVLVKHPQVRGLSFTGSAATGHHLAGLASERSIKYQLEMGGKNPILVAADADLDQAVELTVAGSMRSAGEKCTATSRAIVVKPVLEAFTKKLVEKVKGLKVGPGTQADAYLGPVISEDSRKKILGYIETAKKEGAQVLTGGGAPADPALAHGHYVEPTVLANVKPTDRVACEEVFGPVLAVLPAEDLKDAVAIANGVSFGLSASLCTRDLNAALTYVDQIEAGLVRVNGETAGVEPHAPFGGMKQSSSYSREQGRAAMDFYTQVKTIYIDPAGK